MSFLSKLLPTIGNLLGGPLGGMAVSAAADALGMSEPTREKIEAALTGGQLTPEQLSALQSADMTLKAKLAELGIEAQKVAMMDRDSARKMQIATGSMVPHVIAILFVGFYLVIVALLLDGSMKLWENSTLTMILGTLTSGVAMILGYYFGSSAVQPSTDKK